MNTHPKSILPTNQNVTSLGKLQDKNQLRPLIPPGEYLIGFDYFETAYHFGKSPKLIMNFHVVDFGHYFETPLSRWYGVDRIGKPSRGGTFKAKSQTSILLIEYYRCLRESVVRRLDRVPMSEWSKHVYRAKVGTVSINSQQVALPAQLQYSKIRELLGRADE